MLQSTISVLVGQCVSFMSRSLGLGAGATWPGEIALQIDPKIVQTLSKQFSKGVILVAGTNGKTTTTRMIQTILEADGQSTIHNKSGANLLNGIASALLDVVNKDIDWGIFEIDENSLPIVLKHITPKAIVLLNLFRDQLDRYGEVDVIAEKWQNSLKSLESHERMNRNTTLILNADDPLIAHLGKAVKPRPGLEHAALYFGLEEASLQKKELEHATDSTFCLNCGARLNYKGIYYSHIGIWNCPQCGEKRPKPDISDWKSPLPGVYNRYNTLAAVAVAKSIGISDTSIKKSLENFKPAFGRQEEFEVDKKKVKIFLSKNPAGFNQSLSTVLELGAKQILLVLNDRIPDGRDVSWIWDVDFKMIPKEVKIIVSGDRVYDMAVRLKYAEVKHVVFEQLSSALQSGLGGDKKETLYVLATYSGMLEVRKLLTGRKIL